MDRKIRFVSGNIHKFAEIQKFIQDAFPHISIVQSNKQPIEIQADTLEEIATEKVLSVKSKVQRPYFIEDAGFFVDGHLKGFPGPYSHYVMDTIGCEGILKLIASDQERKAHFESVIAYIDENEEIHLFKGINSGIVAISPRGSSGFGFDPIFISDDYPDRTYAELTMEENNKVSHRSRSLTKLIEYLFL